MMENHANNKPRGVTNKLLVFLTIFYVIESMFFIFGVIKYRKLADTSFYIKDIKQEDIQCSALAVHLGDRVICLTKGDTSKLMSTLSQLNATGIVILEKEKRIDNTNKAINALAVRTKRAIEKQSANSSIEEIDNGAKKQEPLRRQ